MANSVTHYTMLKHFRRPTLTTESDGTTVLVVNIFQLFFYPFTVYKLINEVERLSAAQREERAKEIIRKKVIEYFEEQNRQEGRVRELAREEIEKILKERGLD